jgi:hypothetical protein
MSTNARDWNEDGNRCPKCGAPCCTPDGGCWSCDLRLHRACRGAGEELLSVFGRCCPKRVVLRLGIALSCVLSLLFVALLVFVGGVLPFAPR